VLPKDVKDLYYDVWCFSFVVATKDEDVIHVDSHDPFINEVLKMLVHHHFGMLGGLLVRTKNMTRGSNKTDDCDLPCQCSYGPFPELGSLSLEGDLGGGISICCYG